MNNDEEEKDEESPPKTEKKSDKEKEKLLDDSFKKAESLRRILPQKKEEENIIKKPFIKLGIIIIIIAIIGFALINYIPWMYINCKTDYGSLEEYFYYRDFRDDLVDSNEVKSLFDSTCTNCSDNSDNYIGLTINDFSNTPKTTSYIFIFQAILGIIFTIFVIIDRKRNFAEEKVWIIHSIITAFILIIGIIIIMINIKFLGAHLLYQLNQPFIEVLGLYNVKLFFFMPYILFLFSIGLFILGLAFVRINLNKAVNKLEFEKTDKLDSNFRFGSNI